MRPTNWHLWLLRVALILALGFLWWIARHASGKKMTPQAPRSRTRFGQFREVIAGEHGLAKATAEEEGGTQHPARLPVLAPLFHGLATLDLNHVSHFSRVNSVFLC